MSFQQTKRLVNNFYANCATCSPLNDYPDKTSQTIPVLRYVGKGRVFVGNFSGAKCYPRIQSSHRVDIMTMAIMMTMSKLQFKIAQRVFLSNYMPINGYGKSLVDCVHYKMIYFMEM